jgi:hypothetical protein
MRSERTLESVTSANIEAFAKADVAGVEAVCLYWNPDRNEG